MAGLDTAEIAGSIAPGASAGARQLPPRSALAAGLALGFVLGAALVAILQTSVSDSGAITAKDEARLASSAGLDPDAPTAACTALVQDRFTGVTVAVDCGIALPSSPARPAREIES